MDERDKLLNTPYAEKNQSGSTLTDDNQEEKSLYIDENMKSSDSIPYVDDIIIENTETSLSNSSNNHSDDEQCDDHLLEKKVNIQDDYELPEFPADLKLVVEQKDMTKLAGHTHLRGILLNLVYADIANEHKLL
jgi:hypothetical protein